MSYGFVYVLGNGAMPGLYKVGFTERSPSARCAELSNATGVPMPFAVICYAEFENAFRKEQEIHQELAAFRVSENREFFRAPLRKIYDAVMNSGDDITCCEHNYAAWEFSEEPADGAPRLRAVGGFD